MRRKRPSKTSKNWRMVHAKFGHYRTKYILCQMQENFYDPESGSSSGATHVPNSTPTILSSRTLPRCDSGLPRTTQYCTRIMRNVLARPPAQDGQYSTIFRISKNLASSSQDLRSDISETARTEMKRESLYTQTQLPHFQSRSGIQNHTGGTILTVV